MKKWQLFPEITTEFTKQHPAISPVLLQLLFNRGLKGEEEINTFLTGRLEPKLVLGISDNPEFDFYINDHSVDVSVDSTNAAAIKRVISTNIGLSTGVLVLVGKNTYKSGWVKWEIEKAIELKKKLIAVKLEKDCIAPTPLLNAGASWALSFTLDGIKKAIEAAYK